MTVLQFKPRAAPAPVKSPMTTTFSSPATFARTYTYIWISMLISPWTLWLEAINEQDNAEVRRRGGA